jgi:3-methylcrotonyl-CoA carboxylase alpha subunit
MKTNFRKVLIANRGEIAVRIIRSLERLGIIPVVVYAADDRDALFVRLAREKYLLEGNEPSETYLNIPQLMEVARRSGSDAIHPGYGFLSENPLLAEACHEAGISFIGPSAEVIRLMGDKLQATQYVASLGLPVIPRVMLDQENLPQSLKGVKFPVMVKAVAGGGGKGMRRVDSATELERAFSGVQREALAYFGDGRLYTEQFLDDVRHIEVQVLGDGQGNAVHLFERECTIQRRNQKIIEEAPSPSLSAAQREKVCAMAVEIASSVNYEGAGTIEFLLQGGKDFFFLEMNTRIQVEHPVTEMITGRDLIADQIHIAQTGSLPLRQQQAGINGHAIEARIYAEDPENGFEPTPGDITLYREPRGEGIRIDSGLDGPAAISGRYDPMIAKLIAHAPDRAQALQRLQQALEDYALLGIRNNIPYLAAMTRHKPYISNELNTGYCAAFNPGLIQDIASHREAIPEVVPLAVYALGMLNHKPVTSQGRMMPVVAGSTGYWRQQPFFSLKTRNKEFYILLNFFHETLNIHIDETVYAFSKIRLQPGKVSLVHEDREYHADFAIDPLQHMHCVVNGRYLEVSNALTAYERPQGGPGQSQQNGDSETIKAPMHGKVIHVGVKEMQQVKKGDVLMIIEAMKMENNILAPRDAMVKSINAAAGSQVIKNKPIITIQ